MSLWIEDEGTFYFSYDTCIAFRGHGQFIIRENEWGPTTGKHLNFINTDKSLRISSSKFKSILAEIPKTEASELLVEA